MDKINNEGKTINEVYEELDDQNPFVMSVEDRLSLLKKLKEKDANLLSKESLEKQER